MNTPIKLLGQNTNRMCILKLLIIKIINKELNDENYISSIIYKENKVIG